VCGEGNLWTFTDAVLDRKRYRVHLGTKLIILDDRGNDLFYHADESKGRVEVAIVIPALAETIGLLDQQIERAEELLGADRAHLFLRAIKEHVADKLQLQGN
jgi:hypothetical protein